MMSHSHELGQGWVPEDGVVWQADVGDVEVDELGAVVVAPAEGDRKADLPYWCGGTVSHSSKRLGWLEVLIGHLEALECVSG